MKPNYLHLGLSSPMSSKLRKLVESQLLEDLKFYGVEQSDLKFDWSDSCIEGHLSNYLNSSVENYSGIKIFDSKNNLIVSGWMDYVNETEYKSDGTFFLAFWDFVTVWKNNLILHEKAMPGIPKHIFKILPENLKNHFKN